MIESKVFICEENMGNIQLIKFKPADATFIKNNLPFYFKDNSVSNIRSIINRLTNELGYFILYNKEKVGIISLSQKDEGYSWGIAVIDKYQNNGIASKAFQLICAEAKKQCITKIISSCKKSNTPSIKLHEKVGFKLVKEETNAAGNEMLRWEINI